eukprot:Rmarinus@m.3812
MSDRPLNSQIKIVIDYLKENAKSMSIKEISQVLCIDVARNLEHFKAHLKLKFDEESQLFSYVSPYNIRGPEDVIAVLRDVHPSGIKKEEFDQCAGPAFKYVEEALKTGKIFVVHLHNTKAREDPRVFFWRDVRYEMKVDPRLKKSWHNIKIPDLRSMQEYLRKRECTVHSIQQAVAPEKPTKKRRRK